MQKSHNQVAPRFKSTPGITYEVDTACGKMFVTCNNYHITECSTLPKAMPTVKLKEVFIRLGKAGGCAIALNESVGKLISHYLQEGGDVHTVLKSLSGVSCHQASATVPSCVSAVAEVLKEHINQTKEKGE